MGNEVWKPIPGFPSYEASSLGRVRKGGRVLTLTKRKKNGRLVVGLRSEGKQSTMEVSVAVCSAFHGPRPDGRWALHKNDVKTHNSADNLYWGTPKDNAADAKKNGGLAKRSKLTQDEVKFIRDSAASGVSGSDLAARLSVSKMLVSLVINNKRWVEA